MQKVSTLTQEGPSKFSSFASNLTDILIPISLFFHVYNLHVKKRKIIRIVFLTGLHIHDFEQTILLDLLHFRILWKKVDVVRNVRVLQKQDCILQNQD